LIVSATYEFGKSEPNTSAGANGGTTEEDLEVLGLGANVTFGGFAVGAGYVDFNDSGLTPAQVAAGRDSGSYYNVGVAYGTGPWNVSLGWFHSEVGNTAPASDTETDFYTLGATYNLAPGWQIASDFNIISIDNQNGGAGAAAVDNDYMALVVTNIFKF
jgi:predicted porin